VRRGESLIQQTYEAIRNSPHWNESMLIVTWDEHGGFYDHMAPGSAPAPADGAAATFNQSGFKFDTYGPRVPAVVISPLIPKNLVDHRVYDHASLLATVESVFGLAPLTARDRAARNLNALCTLSTARTDAPVELPDPAADESLMAMALTDLPVDTVAAPNETVNEGNLPAIVHSALSQDLAVSPPEERPAILARVDNLRTRADAQAYMAEVQEKIRPVRQGAAGQ